MGHGVWGISDNHSGTEGVYIFKTFTDFLCTVADIYTVIRLVWGDVDLISLHRRPLVRATKAVNR